MNREFIAKELVNVAKYIIAKNELDREELELTKLAKGAGISISYQDKYAKGYKARGPRNWRKVNVSLLQDAIKNNKSSVTLWRG